MQKEAFIIGDIHGCLFELEELIKNIDRKQIRIISVGDLIDRGENSRGVIDFIRKNNIEVVKGNHEIMLLECENIIKEILDTKIKQLTSKEPMLEDFELDSLFLQLHTSDWWYNGGDIVFNEYNNSIEDLKQLITDIEWIKTWPEFIKTGILNKENQELIVSHTWILPWINFEGNINMKFNEQVWNRFLPKKDMVKNNNFFNIFGHTTTDTFFCKLTWHQELPPSNPEPIFFKEANSICIDTGCVYNETLGRAFLTGIFFPSLSFFQIENKFKTF